MKKKICIVLTYRGNYGKMKSTMQRLNQCDNVELQIVVGGSMNLKKYGTPSDILIRDGFHVNEEAFFLLEGDSPLTMTKSTGHAISELQIFLKNLGRTLSLPSLIDLKY